MADDVKNLLTKPKTTGGGSSGAGNPQDPAAPTPPQSLTIEERFAAMEAEQMTLRAENARLAAMLQSGAVNPGDAMQETKSRLEQEAIRKEVDKGNEQRTQEACDKMFPGGKHRWKCVLEDGNRQPTIAVGADNEVDAAGRYLAACGIKSAEKQVTVLRA